MKHCPRCGKELPDEAEYCTRCGEHVGLLGSERRHRYASTSWLDGVGFGVFLIAAAWVIIQFPFFWGDLVAWAQTFSSGITMPPAVLVEPLAVFFTIEGWWGIGQGVIRGVSGGSPSQAVSDIVGGCLWLAFVYVLRGYAAGIISPSFIVPFFIIGIGVSVLVSGLVSGFAFSRD